MFASVHSLVINLFGNTTTIAYTHTVGKSVHRCKYTYGIKIPLKSALPF